MLIDLKNSSARRRGVILIVILGMLALMALIGVTFATFSGQAQVNARNFSQSKNNVRSAEMMDFALTQLIYDTANPLSAIRGHSLLRDMYGNDARNNGYLTANPSSGTPIMFQSVTALTAPAVVKGISVPAGYIKCVTNLPLSDPALYSYDFTRWIVKFPGGYYGGATYYVSQTYEVVVDDSTGTDAAFRIFYLPPPDTTTQYSVGTAATSTLVQLPTGIAFVLDGRYLRAFNGSGMSGLGFLTVYGNFRVNPAAYGNFRVFGNDPDLIDMDEDYDACDLENWFLAIQSADGQVIIPSFHRPGILRADPSDSTYPNNAPSTSATNDWRNTSPDSAARFLRPRAVDGHSAISFPDLLPDASTGRITYDIDNDGDGITDSVWLDLGYPSMSDSKGMVFKPLFAFLVIGLNGRLPLNTVGNLELRDDTGTPAFSHAAHLGISPSEIDPTFALQAPHHVNPNTGNLDYSQVDEAGVLVNLTQFRNILTGTIPQPNPYQTPSPTVNQDANRVMFGTDANNHPIYYYLPNSVADNFDFTTTGQVFRTGIPVPGRWGEADFIPGNPNTNPPRPVLSTPNIPFNNLVRAGMSMSYYNSASNSFMSRDIDDDNYNTFDPASGESADYHDAAGALSIPVERIRRYTTPIDAAGDGWMTAFASNSPGNGPTGADGYGRISFFKYFRPPGMPNVQWANPTTPLGIGNPVIPDKTTNPLHGFEAARNPNLYALTAPLNATALCRDAV